MNKQIYLVGNWKSNKTLHDVHEYFENFNLPELSPTVHVVICPSFPYLFSTNNRQIALGAQDISPYPFGAYTGSVAAAMISDICKYVIIGHSERRKYFHETNEDVAKKLRNVLDERMTPILCIDEPYLESQLAFFEPNELQKTIVAYEPLEAIGSGIPDTPQHANEIAKRINQISGADIPVLYGGSVTDKTVAQFISEEYISGVLVGGASLKPSDWTNLINASCSVIN